MKLQAWLNLRVLAVPVVCVLVLCQCKTVRTVKSTRTSISIKDGSNEEEKLEPTEKYAIADRGWDIAADGTRTAKRNNLYEGQEAKGFDGEFGMKKAKLGKTNAKMKEFKTPEYLKMQEFKGTSESKFGAVKAREGNFENSKSSFASKLFSGAETKGVDTFGTYKTNGFDGASKEFKTDGNRAGMNAVNTAPRPAGVAQITGYQQNSSMSMDDVKKLLNPNAYARGTGIRD